MTSGNCTTEHSKWIECCRRIIDPVCIVKNGDCSRVRGPAIHNKKEAQKAVDKKNYTLKEAELRLKSARSAAANSKHSLNTAKAFLAGVKRKYLAGTKALSALAQFSLERVFEPIKVSLNSVSLSKAATGSFRVSVTATILGSRKKLGLNINLRDTTSFAKELGEHVISGLKMYIS